MNLQPTDKIQVGMLVRFMRSQLEIGSALSICSEDWAGWERAIVSEAATIAMAAHQQKMQTIRRPQSMDA